MALSREDLLALWQSSVDPEFARLLFEQEDSGIEVIEASAEIFAFASDAVEQTSQEFFLRPWSGQTYPPASGVRFATVDLVLGRAAPAGDVIVLNAITFRAEEESKDASDEGAVLVPTGRRYMPASTVVFLPGDVLLTEVFVAERAGDGFNLPVPESITLLDSVTSTAGDEASVAPGSNAHRLILAPAGETIPPSSVGQYMLLTAGPNRGQRRRIIGYEQPNPDFPHNGVAVLAPTLALAVNTITGTFVQGELIEQAATGAAAFLLAVNATYLAADRQTPPAFAPGTITGVQSGATAAVTAVVESPDMVAETATAGWQLLAWADLGITSTNPLSPAGGRSPVLDHIGEERNMGRSPGELDEPYRARLYSRPDVVSPNALVRAMNRVLAPYGLTGCLREPSELDTFAGLFYDAPANGPESRRYAYDLDFEVRPADRYKLALDLAEFRGFFIGTVPAINLGEFGMAFDEGFVNFFDAAPFNNFFDGFPVTAAAIRIAVWNALDSAREAGVGFDLVEDRFGC